MTEQTKLASASRPQNARDATWYPLRSWWQPNYLFNQDFGMSAFLEPGELSWMQGLERRLSANTWPGCLPSPLFLHSAPGIMRLPKPRPSRPEQYVWRVSLDVGHFSPSELTLRTREGFLEIGGKHEERPDEHGFIARCFTRKYKLPIGVDPTQIWSMLSGDGVLCVEAPLPDALLPVDIIIPIQVEKEIMGEKKAARPEETPEASNDTRHPPPSAPRVPDTPELSSSEPTMEVPEEEASLQGPDADGHPGNAMVEREDQVGEGKGREEETPTEHAVDPSPSGTADEEGLPESSEHQGALDDPDSPDTHTSEQGEHQDPAHHEEQPKALGELEAPEDPVVEQQEFTK